MDPYRVSVFAADMLASVRENSAAQNRATSKLRGAAAAVSHGRHTAGAKTHARTQTNTLTRYHAHHVSPFGSNATAPPPATTTLSEHTIVAIATTRKCISEIPRRLPRGARARGGRRWR